MSRKFNVGRQNDLLLNDKMHNLYAHLEFITYKDGDGNTITMPRQTKQTAIPQGALWLQYPMAESDGDLRTHKLRVHTDPNATDMENRWPCLFEGYYHPASLTEMPKNPVHGQIWIDDKNTLRMYNNSGVEGKWELVLTGKMADDKYDVFNGMDFQLIDPLLPLQLDTGEDLSLYTVPYESFGKYYTALEHDDEYIYCHPSNNPDNIQIPNYNPQQSENVISVDSESDKYAAKAWVHVNPYNLDKVTKRLIKINKPRIYYKPLSPAATVEFEETEEELSPLTVVANSTRLVEYDPRTMIKVGIANKNKYNKSGMDFKVGDTVIPVAITDQNTGFINIPAGKTEYFAFKSPTFNSQDEYDNRIGRLLKRYSLKEGLTDNDVNGDTAILDHRNDYEIRNGGIVLDKNIYETYDYIYAITYDFKANHSIDGNLIRIHRESLDGPDQMWIGPCQGIPVVFMDGLYLEHYGENGSSIYTYENENIIFAGNDVLDNMQITVISFPAVNTYIDGYGIPYPKEYDITSGSIRTRYEICDAGEAGALQVVDQPLDNAINSIAYNDVILHTPDLKNKIDISGNSYVRMSDIKDAVIYGDAGDSLFDLENFPNPLIFYNGLAGYTYVANEVDIDYDNNSITLHDFGAVNNANGLSTVFAVSLGKDNYRNNGVLIDGVAYDENIHADKQYMVIVDGIVMSPYNEDITIEEGKITITDATLALDSEYTVVELTDISEENDQDDIICVYDDMFAPYSIPIINPHTQNTSNAYDDCDSAVVMCGPGVLVDREAILRDFDASDVFIGGQIIKHRLKSVTGDEVYEWRKYTYSNEYEVLDPILDADVINDCDHFVTYYINDGTVLLNPVNIDDQPVTVFAYTYVDSVDERLLRGHRIIPINVKGHGSNKINSYNTNRTHLYDVGVNSLSTFVNGVMVPHTEKPTTDIKGDFFFVPEQISGTFIPFINRYEKEICENRYSNQDMYNVLMAIEDDTTLTSEIKVLTNDNILDHCLPLKFFNTEYQLDQAKKLKKYVLENMPNNNFMYIIENVENNETVACHRQWNTPRNDNGNLPNSYVTSMRLTPGIINIYVNGILLEKSDYAIFDNNKVMIGFDLVGGQELLPRDYGDYLHPYRVLTDEGFKFIECEGNDEVLIEVRDDLTLKKRTYTIKEISYETYSFDILDYEYPSTLSNTKDVIKIYINGVLYDGDYTNANGVITLLECDLEEDPLYKHLRMHPSAMEEYEAKYGEYIKREDTITFEWR